MQVDAARAWRTTGLDAARVWRGATIAALLAGYAGYYVCRSNLSVASSLIVADPTLGASPATIGAMASLGVLAYALGKPFTGMAGDVLGGRRMFVAGMWATVAATVAFGVSTGVALLTASWVANRFVQSAGWGALTKLVAQWFEPARHGQVIAVLSLSYLFGDAAARLVLGAILQTGAGWRLLFLASAAILAVIAVAVSAVLRERPSAVGLPDPPASLRTVYGQDVVAEPRLRGLLGPLAASPAFWLVCGLSCALTLVREAFNIWIPTLLTSAYRMSPADAARWSALFPLMGGLSVIGVGVASDRLGPGRRMLLAAPLVLLAGLLTWVTASPAVMADARLGLAALAGIALLLIGPYSLLAGAMALELGGKRGAATAAGLIDTAGYLGALLSGVLVGALAQSYGWGTSLRFLSATLLAGSLVAGWLAWVERRRGQPEH